MGFHSILYRSAEDEAVQGCEHGVPDCFGDLALDRIVRDVTAPKQEYRLEGYYQRPLSDLDAVAYRHEVVRDLQRPAVETAVRDFAGGMRTMRACLADADDAFHHFQRDRWFLDAVAAYCEAAAQLGQDLERAGPRSRGFQALARYLAELRTSEGFRALAERTRALQRDVSAIRYTVRLHGKAVRVRRFAGEDDYGASVRATFEKFRATATTDYRVEFPNAGSLNRVEVRILEAVGKLHPEVFGRLDAFWEEHHDYLDGRVEAFDREVQFYLAYLEHGRRIERSGPRLCLPELGTTATGSYASEMFDLALANKLRRDGAHVVSNDFRLDGAERMIVVTGPNQGGKTTYARAFGQIHYLAALGLPVPAADARLRLVDGIFTHFERQERIEDLRGKLHEELARVHALLQHATKDSLVVMNEAFSSTTASDALTLSRRVLRQVHTLGAVSLLVTFLDELASLDESTVSMVGGVDPEDPTVRTYRIARKPANGRAYALAIARKYGLTRDALLQRLPV